MFYGKERKRLVNFLFGLIERKQKKEKENKKRRKKTKKGERKKKSKKDKHVYLEF